MPKLVPFNARFTPEFLTLVDDWRATQRPIPNRGAAIMILATRAVADDKRIATGRAQ